MQDPPPPFVCFCFVFCSAIFIKFGLTVNLPQTNKHSISSDIYEPYLPKFVVKNWSQVARGSENWSQGHFWLGRVYPFAASPFTSVRLFIFCFFKIGPLQWMDLASVVSTRCAIGVDSTKRMVFVIFARLQVRQITEYEKHSLPVKMYDNRLT